jgi:hypothetical protein
MEIDGFEGGCLCALGDADGDHRADLALAAWSHTGAGRSCFVTAFSGSTGKPLWSSRIRSQSGRSEGCLPSPAFVCETADVDGDGVHDVFAGTWFPLDRQAVGRLEILSGASGCTLAAVDEDALPWRWTGPPVAFGDLDGDGASDVVISIRIPPVDHGTFGRVGFEIRSGRDLRCLRRIEVPDCAEPRCGAVGDVDGDGTPDLLISGYFQVEHPDKDSVFPNFVRILSGRTGELLSEFQSGKCEWNGSSILGVADFDHDGRQDVLFSEFGLDDRCAGVLLLSGRDLVPIRRWDMNAGPWGNWSYLGFALADAGDVDGDGTPDFAMGTATPWGDETGYAEVYSGKTGALIRRWSRAGPADAHGAGR